MNLLLGILEESINIISGNSTQTLQKFYNNKTLDERIKAIIRKMQGLKNIKDADSQLIFQLREFKDNLTIGHSDSIEKIIENKSTPEKFRESLSDINDLFNETNRQLSLNLECSYFYKQMLKRIIDEKDLTEEEINSQEDISEDKRIAVINLLQKMTKMKNEINELKHKLEEVEALHKDYRIQVKDIEKELAMHLQATKEKEKMISQLNQQSKKAKEDSQKEIKRKNDEIKTLNKNLQNQKKQLETQKIAIAKQKQEMHHQRSELVKQSQIKANQQGKIKQLQEKLKKNEKKSKDTQKKLQEKNDQIQKVLEQKLKQIEELLKEKESSNAEKEKLIQSSVKIEADNQLVQHMHMIVEHAEYITKNFPKSSYSKAPSMLSSQIAKVYPSMNLEQAKTYLNDRYFNHDTALNALLKELKHATHFDVLYQYPQDKHTIFGDKLKRKRNLLLVCKAEAGNVVGGYTEIGFGKPKPKETSRCFIFASKAEHSIFLRAKKGKNGVTQDSDFLIFGCEQLSLQRNCNYATCEYLNYDSNNLQFQGSHQQRQKFQQMADALPPSHNKIPLQYYEIIQLTFSK